MSTSSREPISSPVPEKAGVWEDFIDIFYAPSSVFSRRANASVWPPLLVVTLLVGGIFFANSRLIEPIMTAEFERAASARMRDNPQITPEMMEQGRSVGMMFARVFAFIGTPIAICLLGVVLWGAGKLFDAQQSLRQSILISAYSFVPMVLAALAVGVQGLLLDVSGYTSRYQVSLSAARFADPDSTSQLVLNLLGRLDLFTIWVTVLLAIGLSVIGRIPRARAAIAAAIVWVAGSLPGLYEALGR